MWRINSPIDETAKDIFLGCIGRVRDHNLKERLTACVYEIELDEKEYIVKVSQNLLHKFLQKDSVANCVTKKEMEDVYTNRMAKKKSPGRVSYDKIKILADNGICPLCGQRVVATLDHYLPKSKYPSLAVTPINLIPCCSDCNKLKLEYTATRAEELLLHPYFDNVDGQEWLKCEILKTKPVAFHFFVSPPASWDTVLIDRVKKHFDLYCLNSLYCCNAATEFSSMSLSFKNVHERDGDKGLQFYLKDIVKSRSAIHINSWQTAMYKSMSMNEWFYHDWPHL